MSSDSPNVGRITNVRVSRHPCHATLVSYNSEQKDGELPVFFTVKSKITPYLMLSTKMACLAKIDDVETNEIIDSRMTDGC